MIGSRVYFKRDYIVYNGFIMDRYRCGQYEDKYIIACYIKDNKVLETGKTFKVFCNEIYLFKSELKKEEVEEKRKL